MSSWNRTPKPTQDGASKPMPVSEKQTIDANMVRERLEALKGLKAKQADAQLKATRENIRQLAAKKAAKKAAAAGGEQGEVKKTSGAATASGEGDAEMKTGEKKESCSTGAKGGSAGSAGGTGQEVEPKGWAGGSDDEDDDDDDDDSDGDDYDDEVRYGQATGQGWL